MFVYIPKIVVENTLLILIGLGYNLWQGTFSAVPGLLGWNLLVLLIVVLLGKIMKCCGLLSRQNVWTAEGTGAMDPLIVLQLDFNYDPFQAYQHNVNPVLIIILALISLAVGSAVGLYHARYWVV